LSQAAYPEKPVRLIVPFSTGGGTDIQGRLLGEKMRQGLGQPVLVDNRTGAGGLIGAQITVESPPDGHTVLFTTATIAVNVTLQKDRMKFDPLKDLDPVVWVSSAPLVLVVHPSVPARNVKDLVQLSMRTPQGLNMGGNTPGSTSHLRVATKYPSLTRRHFEAAGVQAECVKLNGAMELAPSLGLARQIVDLVSTGTTLRENGLVETSVILEISARLIVNRTALKTDRRVAALVDAFRREAEEREQKAAVQ
jgi:ATP phosphoribosyltransferase